MKPEQWVIEDMRRLRKIENRSSIEQSYLDLLQWYVKVIQEKD